MYALVVLVLRTTHLTEFFACTSHDLQTSRQFSRSEVPQNIKTREAISSGT
jgi:hypothetical protein